ncbi:MAG: hypothetical protein ABEH81_03980 [Halopenitus sp.]
MSDDSEDEGHENDVDEDPTEFLDRQFSRDGVISVFIGLAAGKIVEKGVALLAPSTPAKLLAWSAVFPLALGVAWYWPHIERWAAPYLPWMDADQYPDR